MRVVYFGTEDQLHTLAGANRANIQAVQIGTTAWIVALHGHHLGFISDPNIHAIPPMHLILTTGMINALQNNGVTLPAGVATFTVYQLIQYFYQQNSIIVLHPDFNF